MKGEAGNGDEGIAALDRDPVFESLPLCATVEEVSALRLNSPAPDNGGTIRCGVLGWRGVVGDVTATGS